MEKATVRDLTDNLRGKRVLLRADLNVPMGRGGEILDETRITASLYTIRYLLDQGARLIVTSHLGRPKSKSDTHLSLKPVFDRLGTHLPGVKMKFVTDTIGKSVDAAVKSLRNGELLMLENVRFYKEETANDPAHAKKLAALADYFVNDAFGAAHRAHASTEGVAHYIPSVSGFLLEKEIKILGELTRAPKRPLTVIMGGKKVSDKIGVLNSLLEIADNILIGGGMSFTFTKARGGKIGNSILDEPSLDYCLNVGLLARERGVNLVLPIDSVVADAFSNDANTQTVPADDIPDGWEGLDIGPKTIAEFGKYLAKSGTVMWNGPLGVCEFENFSHGTRGVAQAIVETEAVSIIGGGDSASAIVNMGLAPRFTHISTGGGATLEYLEGKKLPGVEALLPSGAKIV
ncbi:MAG: phosphoglycerate kinase [Firmicutes bacterium]|nr:phosphoglycerate kinase [Bacillota bacterium]